MKQRHMTGRLGDGVSALDKPRTEREHSGSQSDVPMTTHAEALSDAEDEVRNSTINTFAEGLDPTMKGWFLSSAKSPYTQLAVYLGAIISLSVLFRLLLGDPASWEPVNFLFFLAYFVGAVYFSKFRPVHAFVAYAAMFLTALLLFGLNISGFAPTPYFLIAFVIVGLIDTVLNNRYISQAAEQAVRLRKLQREVMQRDTFSGKGRRKDIDNEMDGFKERELEFRKQQILFSELLMQLRRLSVTLNEKELFNSLYFIMGKGLNAEAVEVFFLDDDQSRLFVADAAEKEGNSLQKVQLDIHLPNNNENLISRCARDARSFSSEDIERDVLLKGLRDHSPHPTVYCAPLVADNEVRGVLNISKTSKPKLNEMEKRLFVATAAIAGASLNNAKTFLLTQEELRNKEELTEQEKRERIKTRNLLDRIMDRKIVEEVMRNPDRTFSDRIKITTLLADVRGFTRMSEGMNPRQVVNLLNSFFETLTPVIFKYDGTLDKYIGDEIMALFGPPVPRGNNAEMAILCALEMRTAFKKLQRRWQKESGLVLEMGIAMNTGDAIVGFIGSENLTNYTAIGDSVNTAARLEDITPAGKILITESTYLEVRDFVEVKHLGAKVFKGKKQQVNIYEVLSLKTQAHSRKLSDPSKLQPSPRTSANHRRRQSQQRQQAKTAPAVVKKPRLTGARGSVPKSSRYCRICGAKTVPGSSSCSKCGTPL